MAMGNKTGEKESGKRAPGAGLGAFAALADAFAALAGQARRAASVFGANSGASPRPRSRSKGKGSPQAAVAVRIAADGLLANRPGPRQDSLDELLADFTVIGDTAMVRELVGRGARGKIDGGGNTPLMMACRSGSVELVDALLPVSDPKAANNDGATALMEAARESAAVAKRLLPLSDPLAVDSHGRSALLHACDEGRLDCVEALMRASDAKRASASGETPLMRLLDHADADKRNSAKFERVAKKLLARSDPLARDADGRTALGRAAAAGSLALVRALLRHASPKEATERGATPLMLAAASGNDAVVLHLLPLSDAKAKRRDGSSALTLSAGCAVETVKALLAAGCDPTETDGEGKTPLMLAAERARDDLVELLAPLSDVRAADGNGFTALTLACESRMEEPAALRLLIANSDIEARTRLGETALMIAARRAHPERAPIVQALLNAGADLLARIEISARGQKGSTALHLALENGCWVAAEELCYARCASLANENGWTPLMLAARENQEPMIRSLLSVGADPLAVNSAGRSALHVAASYAREDVLAALAPVSDILARDAEGQTAAELAAKTSPVDRQKRLLETLGKALAAQERAALERAAQSPRGHKPGGEAQREAADEARAAPARRRAKAL
jgi:ankyrin repeat protein